MDQPETPIFVRGDILIVESDVRTGQVLREITSRNRVVQSGLSALPVLLAQPTTGFSPTALRIKWFRVGLGTAAPTDADAGLSLPVSGGDVDLLIRNTIVPEGGRLKIVAEVPSALGSGRVTLQEAGLFLSNDALFARQVHAPITTAPGRRVTYNWTLTFSAA